MREKVFRNSFKKGGWMIRNIVIFMRYVINIFIMYIILEDGLLV